MTHEGHFLHKVQIICAVYPQPKKNVLSLFLKLDYDASKFPQISKIIIEINNNVTECCLSFVVRAYTKLDCLALFITSEVHVLIKCSK